MYKNPLGPLHLPHLTMTPHGRTSGFALFVNGNHIPCWFVHHAFKVGMIMLMRVQTSVEPITT